MITDLRLDLRKDSVDNYINSLLTELDKYKLSLENGNNIGDSTRAETVAGIVRYVQKTQVFNNGIPPKEEEEPIDPNS